MNLYSKEGLLLMAQIDHLSGEVLGNVIDRFYEAGAKNVQVVGTITKKNRPAHIVFVDIPVMNADGAEEILVKECAVSGWHRISTCHSHTEVSVMKKDIRLKTNQGTYNFQIEGKVIGGDWKNARPEYENCVKLRRFLLEKEQRAVPIRQIQSYAAEVFHEEREEMEI